jgi:hypothetical protein
MKERNNRRIYLSSVLNVSIWNVINIYGKLFTRDMLSLILKTQCLCRVLLKFKNQV